MSEALDGTSRSVHNDRFGDSRAVERSLARGAVTTSKGNGPRCQLEPLPEDWEPRPVEAVTAPFKRGNDLLQALAGDIRAGLAFDETNRLLGDTDLTADEAQRIGAAFLNDNRADDGPSFGPRALPDPGVGRLRSGRPEHGHDGLGVHQDLGIGRQLLGLCGRLWLRGCQLLVDAACSAGRPRTVDLPAERRPVQGGVQRQMHRGDGPGVTA